MYFITFIYFFFRRANYCYIFDKIAFYEFYLFFFSGGGGRGGGLKVNFLNRYSASKFEHNYIYVHFVHVVLTTAFAGQLNIWIHKYILKC